MFKVKFSGLDKVEHEISFSTHAEASRFVRGCRVMRVKAQLVTREVIPAVRLGGYGRANSLKPVHCARV